MEYLKIVLQGFFNENNREHLDRYFFREFKKAEKENFEADEFFKGCLKVVEFYEIDYKKKVFELKKELLMLIESAENGTFQYGEMEGKTIEQKRKETIEYCRRELATISEKNIKVNLRTRQFNQSLYYDEVLQIKRAILKAFQRTQNDIEALPPQPKKTKAEILNDNLNQYGFFELEKIKQLSEQNKSVLIEKISENGLPYAIAMFDYLQFIPFLEKKHFQAKYKLNEEVSKWFGSDKEGRAVKGNISSLLNNTTENKDRYTAYQHKENVINDYEQLK